MKIPVIVFCLLMNSCAIALDWKIQATTEPYEPTTAQLDMVYKVFGEISIPEVRHTPLSVVIDLSGYSDCLAFYQGWGRVIVLSDEYAESIEIFIHEMTHYYEDVFLHKVGNENDPVLVTEVMRWLYMARNPLTDEIKKELIYAKRELGLFPFEYF